MPDATSQTPPVSKPQEPSHRGPDRKAQTTEADSAPRLPFPVVAMGASAGGLEAFSDFFKGMPPPNGMAFVLIQPLPPEQPSMLVDILSRRTSMPVLAVEEGLAVKPNHAYVIRPG